MRQALQSCTGNASAAAEALDSCLILGRAELVDMSCSDAALPYFSPAARATCFSTLVGVNYQPHTAMPSAPAGAAIGVLTVHDNETRLQQLAHSQSRDRELPDAVPAGTAAAAVLNLVL